jgi:hypothetical protein
LEEEARKGNLLGSEIYMCTDNSTVEASLYKGTSSSKKLFALVVRVRKLELQQQARFIVSHVSGKRMIAGGTDGTSRGQMKEAVSVRENMLGFIPWNESALDRTPLLEPWLRTWISSEVEFLTPEGCFSREHDQLDGSRDALGFWHHKIKPGHFVWAPPPAAADVALEELRKARINVKTQCTTSSAHVCLPRSGSSSCGRLPTSFFRSRRERRVGPLTCSNH